MLECDMGSGVLRTLKSIVFWSVSDFFFICPTHIQTTEEPLLLFSEGKKKTRIPLFHFPPRVLQKSQKNLKVLLDHYRNLNLSTESSADVLVLGELAKSEICQIPNQYLSNPTDKLLS